MIPPTVKHARDEYEMRKRGLLHSSPPWVSRLIWDGLCAPALLAVRLGYGLRDANKKYHATLQEEAFKRTYPIGPEDWAIICHSQLGDVYLFSSLMKGLLSHHGGKRVICFTRPQHAFIPRLFPSISEGIALEPRFLPSIGGSHKFTPYPPDVNKGHYFQPSEGIVSMVGYENMTLLDALRASLRLPREIALEKPRAPAAGELEDAAQFLAQHNLTPGRVVIICPDATSTAMLPSIPEAFWDTLVVGLKKIGLQCVTNVGGPAQRALKDAPGLQIPLEDLRAVACAAGHMISNRSGVCDLVADLPLNLAILYPASPFLCGTLYASTGLRAMGLRDDAIELEIDCQQWRPTMDALLAAMSNRAQKAELILPQMKPSELVAESAS